VLVCIKISIVVLTVQENAEEIHGSNSILATSGYVKAVTGKKRKIYGRSNRQSHQWSECIEA